MQALIDEFDSINLAAHPSVARSQKHQTCVLSNPKTSRSWLRDTFRNIPRYLFRVYSKQSAGFNSSTNLLSVDATEGVIDDIFDRDDCEIAVMLNEHVRWDNPKSKGDSFHSWTASLPFAIFYAIF